MALYLFLFLFLTYRSQVWAALDHWPLPDRTFHQEKLFDIWPTHLNRMADYQTIMNVEIRGKTSS